MLVFPAHWKAALAAAACLLASLAPAAASDLWVAERDHTQISFSWDHLGLARHQGRILVFDARLTFSPTDPEAGSVAATLRVSSISTGHKELDDHLRSADFLDAARHPEITFKSTGVKRIDDKNGELAGDLTIMGVTKPVVMTVRWNLTAEHPLGAINPVYRGRWVSGFSASTVIKRSEFGVRRAIPLVSDEIEIRIEAEFTRKSEG